MGEKPESTRTQVCLAWDSNPGGSFDYVSLEHMVYLTCVMGSGGERGGMIELNVSYWVRNPSMVVFQQIYHSL